MKQFSQFSPDRAGSSIRSRFNPISNLSPQYLTRILDDFDRGELRNGVLLWEQVKGRDDRLSSIVPKREKAVARYGSTIIQEEEGPRAARHAEALRYFFRHLVSTDAVKRNRRRGWSGLVKSMLGCLGPGSAVHEIIWQPRRDGLTAELRHVPLSFFEARNGDLRFLPTDHARDGEPLEEGEWMVTAEDALMPASLIAYQFKTLPLQDLLTYCEKFGVPGVVGKTSAPKDSPEWNAMVEAVTDFMNDFAAVVDQGSTIDFIQAAGGAADPMSSLIDRMDRALTTMWRGGDLSSMSGTKSHAGQGAGLQGDEASILEDDDIALIEDTLNQQIVPWIIRYAVGDDSPLARVTIKKPAAHDVKEERETDRLLISVGGRLGLSDMYARYGREEAGEGEQIAVLPDANQTRGIYPAAGAEKSEGDRDPAQLEEEPEGEGDALANEIDQADAKEASAFLDAARSMMKGATATDFAQVGAKMEAALSLEDPALIWKALRDIFEGLNLDALPGEAQDAALSAIMASAFVNGAAAVKP